MQSAGGSFDGCPNLVIASLEYSYGSLHQARGRVWRVTSRRPVRTWCVLCQGSIEETMFDIVATKQDAATICLQGRRLPREFKPVDLEEVLAESLARRVTNPRSESACEAAWPALRQALAETQRVAAWVLRWLAAKQEPPSAA